MSRKVYVYNLEDSRYKLAGEYKFLEEDIKLSRFDDLIVDIKNIDLFEYNEDDDI